MNKLSKEKRDKLILVCMVIIGVLGGLYTFVLGARKDELATLQSQISGAQAKLYKAEALVRSSAAIEANLAESKSHVEARQVNMAPPGDSYYWFYKLIDQFCKDQRLDKSFIMDLTQPEFIEAGLLPKFPYKAASFGLRLNGHYHDVGKFIATLENSYPYFRVHNMRAVPAVTSVAQSTAKQSPGSGNEKLVIELRIVTLIKPGTT